ncbi:hypothetical protein QQG55_14145 [Brugia pahangi]
MDWMRKNNKICDEEKRWLRSLVHLMAFCVTSTSAALAVQNVAVQKQSLKLQSITMDDDNDSSPLSWTDTIGHNPFFLLSSSVSISIYPYCDH